jgi:undecaprenyl phosphate N,N'-diacetylbacillosamine 1-phosphate transferase
MAVRMHAASAARGVESVAKDVVNIVGTGAAFGIAGAAALARMAMRGARGAAQGITSQATASQRPGDSRPDIYQDVVKRALDIGVGIVAMPVLGVAIAVFGPQIYLEDKGPVFYNAPRVGKNGREYTMYKFRSMKVNAPDLVMEDGSTYNGADDPRLTRVGAFMRRTSLDELPQFINVLNGTMSVVGPRPDLKRETRLYEGDEAEKLLVKPGITGYAAVYGGRNAAAWHDRLALDVWYVRNVGFMLDARIFFKTFSAIFSEEGIYIQNDDGAKAAKLAE